MKYVALLRGINVGGNNKVEMTKLKKMFENLGFTNVSTYINSGNVIFESNKKDPLQLVSEIEKALRKVFGFEVKTIIRDGENIKKLVKVIPASWKNDVEQKTDVFFLWDEFDSKKTLSLIFNNPSVDNLKYISGAIVWNINKDDYTKSGMHKLIGTKVYKNMTGRNINTVRKLAELIT